MSGFFPKKAMVLAAGLGKRMRSHTTAVPKPLVEVQGKPLVDWSLELLEAAGITDIVVNVSYMGEAVEAHLKARDNIANIHISRETSPLETGGGIAKALPLLGEEPFFVLNSDVIGLDGPDEPLLHRMAQSWDAKSMDGLLLVVPTKKATGYSGQGDFFWDGESKALRRRGESNAAPYVFTGIQLLHPRIFTALPDTPFSMNLLYNRGISEDKQLHRFAGAVHDGDWLHVGDGQGVQAAEARLAERAA